MTARSGHAPSTPGGPEGVVQYWDDRSERGSRETLTPGISVVVCTYERPTSMQRFLDSLLRQMRPPDELIVVDASVDEKTEAIVAVHRGGAYDITYVRVTNPLRGLTKQRNLGLRHVAYDLVAFFDDDVELDSTCLEELERAHRSSTEIVGVGCFAETFEPPTMLWRVRRALRMVSDLRPGSYSMSGISVPWRFQPPTDQLVDADWLPGCAMMLKTDAACAVMFDEVFGGYGQAEDLDFSLRLRQRGHLVMAGAARCQHLHDSAGRPDAFQLGQMEIWNRYRICRRVHSAQIFRAHFWFAYAWALDTLLLTRDVIRPHRARAGVRRIAGRVMGASWIFARRST